MKQQVIYSMLAMAVAPAFSYAAVTSMEVKTESGAVNATTAGAVIFDNVYLVKGQYNIKVVCGGNGSNPRLTFRVYDSKGNEVTVNQGRTSTGSTAKDVALNVTAEGFTADYCTIKIFHSQGNSTWVSGTRTLTCKYDWASEDLATWKTAMNTYLTATGNYQSPEYKNNVELQTLKQAANYLGQDTDTPAGVIVDEKGNVIAGAKWNSYAAYAMFQLGDIKQLTSRLEAVKKVINAAEATYQKEQIDKIISTTYDFTNLRTQVQAVADDPVEVAYQGAQKELDGEGKPVYYSGTVKTADAVKQVNDSIDAVEARINAYTAALTADDTKIVDVTAVEEKKAQFDKEAAAAKQYVDDLKDYKDYLKVRFLPYLTDLNYFQTLIDQAKQAIANGKAIMSQWRIEEQEFNSTRFRAKKQLFDTFLAKTQEAWAAEAKFARPSNVTVITPAYTLTRADETTKTWNAASKTVAHMQAALENGGFAGKTGEEQEGLQSAQNAGSLRGDIAFFKFLVDDYNNAYDKTATYYDNAVKNYNTKVTDVEVAIHTAETNAEGLQTWYDQLLENAKSQMKVYKENLDVVRQKLQDIREGAKQLSDNDNNDKFYKDDNIDDHITPAYKLQHDMKDIADALDAKAAEWAAKATDARVRYDKMNDLINKNIREVIQDITDNYPEDVQKIVEADLKDLNDVQLPALINKVKEINTTIDNKDADDLGDDNMVINDAAWDPADDNSANWGKVSDDEPVTYGDLAAKAADLLANVKQYTLEHEAYKAILASLSDLETRLLNASTAIDALTPAASYSDPAYQGSTNYGFKAIDNLDTDVDEAAENTNWAKTITDYIREKRAQAVTAYGDGTGTGAQMMKNGHETVKKVVSTDSKDGWTVPGDATAENGKLTLPTGGNSQIEVGAINNTEVRVHVKIDGLTTGKLWCYLISDGGNNMINKGEGVACDQSWGQENGEVVFTLTGVPTPQNNVKLQFFTSGVQYSVSDIYITEGEEHDIAESNINGNIFDGIEQKVSELEKDGYKKGVDEPNAHEAVTHLKAVLDQRKKDQEDLAALLAKVQNHGVYTDKTSTLAHAGEYATIIEGFQTELDNQLKAINEAKVKFDIEHWKALNALSADPVKYGSNEISYYDDSKIAQDKAEYELDAYKQRVSDLNDQLQGTSKTTGDEYDLDGIGGYDAGTDGVVYANGEIVNVLTKEQTGFLAQKKAHLDDAAWGDDVFATAQKTEAQNTWNDLRKTITDLETKSGSGRKAVWESYLVSTKTENDVKTASNGLLAISEAIKKLLASADATDMGDLNVMNNIAKAAAYTDDLLAKANDNKHLRDSLVGENFVATNYSTLTDGVLGKYRQRLTALQDKITQSEGKLHNLDSKPVYPGAPSTFNDELNNLLNGNVAKVDVVDDGTVNCLYQKGTLRKEFTSTLKDIYDNDSLAIAAFEQYCELYSLYLKTEETLQAVTTGAIYLIQNDEAKYGNTTKCPTFLNNLEAMKDGGTFVVNLTTIVDAIKKVDYNTVELGSTAANKIGSKHALQTLVDDAQAKLNVLGHDLTIEIAERGPQAPVVSNLKALGDVISKIPTNMILRELNAAEDNKKAYDEIIAAKVALGDRATEIIAELSAPNKYDQDMKAVKDIITLVTDKYKPVPTNMSPAIEEKFAEGTSIYEGQDTKILEADGQTLKYYPQLAILKDSLTALNKLYTNFATDEYNQAIIAENDEFYNGMILPAYQGAMQAYNALVNEVNNDFTAPKDPDLLAMFEAAKKKLHDAIYLVPSQLLAAKNTATDNYKTANDITDAKADRYSQVENDPVDPNNLKTQGYKDLKVINDLKAEVEDAKTAFETALVAAMTIRWNGGSYTDKNGATKTVLDILKYEGDIAAAWTTVKDYFAHSENEAPYSQTLQSKDGDAQTHFAAIYAPVKQAMDCMALAQHSDFNKFDNLLPTLADENNGVKAELKKAVNADANNDLLALIANKIHNVVKPNEGDKNLQLDDNKTTETTYQGQLYGTGTTDYKGSYYTYKYAVDFNNANGLSTTPWAVYEEMFNALKANTTEKAEKQRNTYNAAVQLPEYTDENAVLHQTRQEVADLIELYDNSTVIEDENGDPVLDANGNEVKKWNAIKALLDAEYATFMTQTVFLGNLDDFKKQFANIDKPGIESLIVGSKYAEELKEIDDALKAGVTTQAALDELNKKLLTAVNNAKADEYTEMANLLSQMHAEYNTLIAQNDPDLFTDPDEKAAATTKRQELIETFASGTNITTEPGNKNIALNETTLESYENDRSDNKVDTPSTFDNDKSYDKYLEIEANVAQITIAIEEAKTGEKIDQGAIAEALDKALGEVEGMTSEYINGQMLFAPENPDFTGDDAYKTTDFGLKQYYSEGNRVAKANDFDAVKKDKDNTLKPQLDAIKADIKAHGTEDGGKADISFYKQTIEAAIDKLKHDVNVSDLYFNDNTAVSAHYTNLANIAKAEKAKEAKEKLLADIDAVEKLIQPAVEKIEKMGFTADETYDETVASYKLWLQNAKDWVQAQYLALALDENSTVPSAAAGSAYQFKLSADGTEVSNTWGIIAHSLSWYEPQLNALVQEYVKKRAQALYKEAADAWTTTKNAISDNVDIKAATKNALLAKINTLSDAYDASGDPADATTIADKKDVLNTQQLDRNYGNIFQYQADVEAFIALLGVSYDDEGNLVATGGILQELADEKVGDLDKGNGTGDGTIDVFDLTELLNMVNNPGMQPNKATDPKLFAAYDLNGDGRINIVDLGIELDLMGGKTAFDDLKLARAAERFAETLTAEVVAKEGNRQRIAISLNNWRNYFAFQMDVKLPQGMKLVASEMGERATTQTISGSQWAGGQRIVAFTTARNDVFTGNDGAVIYLDVETDNTFRGGQIEYNDIMFLTSQNIGVSFQMNGTETTGIMARFANATKQTIYNMGGRIMDGLKKGVNILRGENGETEKVIKK